MNLLRYGITTAATISVLGGAACSKDSAPFVDPIGKESPLPTPIETYIPPSGTASETPTMKIAAGGMQYWISVPKGWPGNRTWPVVMALTGSGKDFEIHANNFARVRDQASLPFILVTPEFLTVSGDGPVARTSPAYHYPSAVWDVIERDGRCAFDLNGAAAVMADVRAKFSGQSKTFLTGFSGGGNSTWAMVFLKTELLRAVAPVASNFSGRCVTKENNTNMAISSIPERVQLPVHTFIGSIDPFLPFGSTQTEAATTLLRSYGFTNFKHTVVPNVAHDPMPSLVLSYFYSLLNPSEH